MSLCIYIYIYVVKCLKLNDQDENSLQGFGEYVEFF